MAEVILCGRGLVDYPFSRPDTPAAGKWDIIAVPLFNFMIQQFFGLTPNTHISVYLCRYLSSPPKIIFAQ